MTPLAVAVEHSSPPAVTVQAQPGATVEATLSALSIEIAARQFQVALATPRIDVTCSPTSYRSDLVILEPTPVLEVRTPPPPTIAITTCQQGPPGAGTGGGAVASDVTSAVLAGAIEVGDLVTEGTTLDDFVRQLLLKTFYPTLSGPSATLLASLGSTVEVGTVANLVLTAVLNRGSINGDMVGGTWSVGAWQDYRAGEFIAAYIDGVLTAGVRTLLDYLVEEGANSFSATIDYDQGPQPVDSEGEDYSAPLPAGTVSASRAIYGRRRMFYGTPSTIPTDSDTVRALASSGLNPGNGTSFTIHIPAGAEQVVIAYPATLRGLTTVKYVEGLNAEVKDVFAESSVTVAGANGYSPIAYRVYSFTPAEPFPQSATYSVTI